MPPKVPLGQPPTTSIVQRHEALQEVDVSEMALRFSFGQRPEGKTSECLE